jgi:hypothetical protein
MAAHLMLQDIYGRNGVEIKHVFEPTRGERASATMKAH